MRVRAPVALGERQGRLSVEAVHADQRVAQVQRPAAEDGDGGVVVRRGQQVRVRLALGDAEERQQPGAEHHRIVGIQPGQPAADALRPAGCPRCVVHGGASGPVGGQRAGLARAQVGHAGHAGHGAVAESRVGRDSGLVRSVGAQLGEALMHEERLGAAIRRDVGGLRRGEVPVDGGEVPAGLEGGQVDLDRRHAVGQQGGDAVARLQAPRRQRVRQLVDPLEKVARAVLRAIGIDDRDPARIFLRPAPEPLRSHCHLPGPASVLRTSPADGRTCSSQAGV